MLPTLSFTFPYEWFLSRYFREKFLPFVPMVLHRYCPPVEDCDLYIPVWAIQILLKMILSE